MRGIAYYASDRTASSYLIGASVWSRDDLEFSQSL
jgi:hypothetical protein